MSLFEPFRAYLRPSNNEPWYFAGKRSSFPDVSTSVEETLSDTISHPTKSDPGIDGDASEIPLCRIIPIDQASRILTPSEAISDGRFDNQVLVFQYRGKFHAVDHQCPHNSFPLSAGRVSDIEDFGIVLSAEITCPKHGWAFDLFTGQSDRGSYQLRVWEVEVRPATDETEDEEIWVRKKVKARQG